MATLSVRVVWQLGKSSKIFDMQTAIELSALSHHAEHLSGNDSSDRLDCLGLIDTTGQSSSKR